VILVDGIATVVLSATKCLSAAVHRARTDGIAGHSGNASAPHVRGNRVRSDRRAERLVVVS
jgi:hypothetical protein